MKSNPKEGLALGLKRCKLVCLPPFNLGYLVFALRLAAAVYISFSDRICDLTFLSLPPFQHATQTIKIKITNNFFRLPNTVFFSPELFLRWTFQPEEQDGWATNPDLRRFVQTYLHHGDLKGSNAQGCGRGWFCFCGRGIKRNTEKSRNAKK